MGKKKKIMLGLLVFVFMLSFSNNIYSTNNETNNNNVFEYNFNLENTLIIIFVLLIFSFLAFLNIMRFFSSLVIVIIGFILLDLHVLIGLIIIMYGFIISFLEV